MSSLLSPVPGTSGTFWFLQSKWVTVTCLCISGCPGRYIKVGKGIWPCCQLPLVVILSAYLSTVLVLNLNQPAGWSSQSLGRVRPYGDCAKSSLIQLHGYTNVCGPFCCWGSCRNMVSTPRQIVTGCTLSSCSVATESVGMPLPYSTVTTLNLTLCPRASKELQTCNASLFLCMRKAVAGLVCIKVYIY